MNTVIANNIQISDPSPEILKWAKDNLVFPNPEYGKKARMGFYTGKTPKSISLYEIRGNTLVLPYGVLGAVLHLVPGSPVESAFSESPQVPYDCEIPLYDYQKDAVNAMYNARYGLLQSAAGSGKTQMGIALINKWGRRALWLCHTADLLAQSRDRAARYMNPALLGTVTEGEVNLGTGITFATVQTMCRLDLAQYRDYWDVIVVDEAHRVSGSPTQMTRYFKVLNALSARHKYGLTATPSRSDGLIKATCAILGDVMYRVPDEAVADNVMRVGIKCIETDVGLTEECLNPDGILNYTGMIKALCENPMRNHLIASHIVSQFDHSCLILSDRLEHLEAIMKCLPAVMRKDAVMISGKMTSRKEKAEREKFIGQMRNGEKKYLFATYSLAKEGLDIPRLERLFMATPVKYNAIVIQSIGRIARTFEGKKAPIVYDFVDSIPYCQKAYRERCKHYKRAGAYFL